MTSSRCRGGWSTATSRAASASTRALAGCASVRPATDCPNVHLDDLAAALSHPDPVALTAGVLDRLRREGLAAIPPGPAP